MRTPQAPTMATLPRVSLTTLVKPSYRQFLTVWLGLGIQSFGGGAATLALIRRAVVDKYGWLTADEFTRDWALCQVSPGINLLGITILIGRRVLGIPGIVIALFGLLFPSCLITVLITAAYAKVHNLAVVRAALNGIIPATVGIGVVPGLPTRRSIAHGRLARGARQLCL